MEKRFQYWVLQLKHRNMPYQFDCDPSKIHCLKSLLWSNSLSPDAFQFDLITRVWESEGGGSCLQQQGIFLLQSGLAPVLSWPQQAVRDLLGGAHFSICKLINRQVSRPTESSSDWDSPDVHLMFTWPPDHHLTFPWPSQDPYLTLIKRV